MLVGNRPLESPHHSFLSCDVSQDRKPWRPTFPFPVIIKRFSSFTVYYLLFLVKVRSKLQTSPSLWHNNMLVFLFRDSVVFGPEMHIQIIFMLEFSIAV